VALNKNNETERALARMESAARIAMEYNFKQSFINEGTDVLPMILSLREKTDPDDPLKYFTISLAVGVMECITAESVEKPKKLSPMRREALKLLDKGFSYNEIADELNIKRATVKRHIMLAYDQLGVHDAKEAIAKAKVLGLL
jgi:LuxR family maltose regulon positive regulatory protein